MSPSPFKRSQALIKYPQKLQASVLPQFISKLFEKVVAKQLNEFISYEGLLNVNQSVYKSSHSTETALIKIQNDIAFLVDSGKAVALILLDLSAALTQLIILYCMTACMTGLV